MRGSLYPEPVPIGAAAFASRPPRLIRRAGMGGRCSTQISLRDTSLSSVE